MLTFIHKHRVNGLFRSHGPFIIHISFGLYSIDIKKLEELKNK